jgi:hypothetical protein
LRRRVRCPVCHLLHHPSLSSPPFPCNTCNTCAYQRRGSQRNAEKGRNIWGRCGRFGRLQRLLRQYLYIFFFGAFALVKPVN